MPRETREKIIFFFLAILILLLDFFTKYLAMGNMRLGQSIPVIPGIFHITLVMNSGTAFGLFKSLSGFFAFFSLGAILVISYILFVSNNLSRICHISLALILAGASGNFLDRIRFGNVIDFLDFRIWPVFNIADSAITVGVCLLIFEMVFKAGRTEKKNNH